MNGNDLDQGIQRYEEHLRHTAKEFNDYAIERGLDVRMNPGRVLEAIKHGVGLAKVAPFWQRSDDTGIVHDSQLRTAIDCVVEMLADNKRCGHVVGAMQSGKTTTSLALQWAGPILYLRTARRAYPFYIIGNQLNHEDQTTTELQRFLAYYGDVELGLAPGVAAPSDLDPVFDRSPSLSTYRERVLLGAFNDYNPVPQLADIVHRRVGGEQSLKKIVELCQRATEKEYRPLMIIDEPQFGASDRVVEGAAGLERRECVLARIFGRIEQALGSTRDDHWFVGLSATPFELNDLQRFWEVRQSLTQAYSGFNVFNGSPISPGVDVIPPETLSLTRFAEQIGVEFLAKVSLAAYDGTPTAFARHARRIGYDDDQEQYRAETETALREAIYRLLEKYHSDPEGPVGLCIRAFNDNRKTRELIDRLALDRQRIEIVDYYGSEMGGVSVKRVIARRNRPELPYLVLVTNRARMADAFPKQVRFFMDLAQRASDLNALLQGLLGRACGYHKNSTVVLSDGNAEIVRAYVATNGGYVHKTSRHSMAVGGGFRRGAPTGMLKLRVDMDDETVKEFFRRINMEVVSEIPPGAKMKVSRKKQGRIRMRPILGIAEDLGLFEHVEDPAVRAVLYPEFVSGFKVVRRGEKVRHSRNGTELTYAADANGNCRFTFRHRSRSDAARGGAAGRAKGAKDVGQHIEPTVYVEKYDPSTGAVIDSSDQGEGRWRAFMVTFPLRETVRTVHVAEVAYPISTCAYDSWLSESERNARDKEVQRRAAAGAS